MSSKLRLRPLGNLRRLLDARARHRTSYRIHLVVRTREDEGVSRHHGLCQSASKSNPGCVRFDDTNGRICQVSQPTKVPIKRFRQCAFWKCVRDVPHAPTTKCRVFATTFWNLYAACFRVSSTRPFQARAGPRYLSGKTRKLHKGLHKH